jgi:hypothetical protein
MIKPLRKRHRQIWMAWAVLLPVGIVFAWLVIPNQAPVKLLQASSEKPLPVEKKSVDKDNYTVNLRTNNENSAWQLEWINKTALMVPSAVIYKVDDPGADISQSKLIGRIEANGRYIFPLEPDSTGYKDLKLVLYDFIHDKKIDSINFQP